MEKNILLLVGILIMGRLHSNVQAQVISDPQSNRPYYSSPSDRTGDPLLLENWEEGTILSEKGVRYKGIRVNYDAIQKSVVFKVGVSVYLFNEPVREFTVNSEDGGQIRRFIRSDKLNPDLPGLFVELLDSGRINFFKHITKSVVEITEYNSVPRKSIEEKTAYFVVKSGKVLRVTLSKKSLQEALPEWQSKLESFIRQNGLSPKNENDWTRIIEFCNKQE